MAAPLCKEGTEPGLQGLSRTPPLHGGADRRGSPPESSDYYRLGLLPPTQLGLDRLGTSVRIPRFALAGKPSGPPAGAGHPPPTDSGFVAPRQAGFPACYPHGFHAFQDEGAAAAFLERLRQHGFFVERERAERTPAWKQPIPYCVVASEERILLMKRRAKGGEARLHDKLSIGVGGHINPVDREDGTDLLLSAARREIAEELEVR